MPDFSRLQLQLQLFHADLLPLRHDKGPPPMLRLINDLMCSVYGDIFRMLRIYYADPSRVFF